MQMLTRNNLATLMQVRPRTVDKWARDGQIPSPVRIGRKSYWPRAEFESWLRAQCFQQEIGVPIETGVE